MRIKLNTSENFFFTFLKAIRIHQWVKNFLVFIPMLASHQITIQNINNSFLAFIAFCIEYLHYRYPLIMIQMQLELNKKEIKFCIFFS